MSRWQLIGITATIAVLHGASAEPANPKPFTADCLLQIEGVNHIDGRCRVTPDFEGSFGIEQRSRDGRVFAFLNNYPYQNSAAGNWNGKDKRNFAEDDLGTLTPSGGCWINDKVRMCVWKKGERRFIPALLPAPIAKKPPGQGN